jgi:hypothetical protein
MVAVEMGPWGVKTLQAYRCGCWEDHQHLTSCRTVEKRTPKRKDKTTADLRTCPQLTQYDKLLEDLVAWACRCDRPSCRSSSRE